MDLPSVDRSSQGIFVRSSSKEDDEYWEDQTLEGQIFGSVEESNFMWFRFYTLGYWQSSDDRKLDPAK
jgi:hypothetical protein